MKNQNPLLHTPEGVRDIYGNEFVQKFELQQLLYRILAGRGYQGIETPTFEFFDVFSREVGTVSSRELYKFFDKEGNTLVLRPDMTPSIARAVSKYFHDETPIRLCYMGNTFINYDKYQGRLKETTQMGAELMGDGSVASDVELLSVLIEALQEAGLREFQVSVGQVEFFKALLREAGIGNAAKHGFLVKEGDALERLAAVKRIAFDKTGTLTYGKPEVIAVRGLDGGMDEDTVYRLAAAAESLSEHPLGKAIVSCCKKEGIALRDVKDFQMIPGRGVCAEIENKKILAGNAELLREHGISMPELPEAEGYVQQGCTVIYLAAGGQLAGFLALSDTLRKESADTISALSGLGVQPVLLTGDHQNAAKSIADKLHIREVLANCLPEDKLKAIAEYQNKDLPVCMIGDGVK